MSCTKQQSPKDYSPTRAFAWLVQLYLGWPEIPQAEIKNAKIIDIATVKMQQMVRNMGQLPKTIHQPPKSRPPYDWWAAAIAAGSWSIPLRLVHPSHPYHHDNYVSQSTSCALEEHGSRGSCKMCRYLGVPGHMVFLRMGMLVIAGWDDLWRTRSDYSKSSSADSSSMSGLIRLR
jgi:hypothetical protein